MVRFSGHSVCTAVTPHAGATVVIRADLAAFFDSDPAGRIWNLLRVAGLPEGVARTVTGLVTTVAPVDDLTFSGGTYLRSRQARFVELVDQIVRAEGFTLNDRKTVVLGDAGRQALLGTVINHHPTLVRPERDELRAILHNCASHGWRSQTRGRDNYAEHLRGRIAWAAGLDPALGAKLLAAYDLVDWT